MSTRRPFKPLSLIRQEHPDAYDREQFELQDAIQRWHLLWWEKQEQLNFIWWQYKQTDPRRIK